MSAPACLSSANMPVKKIWTSFQLPWPAQTIWPATVATRCTRLVDASLAPALLFSRKADAVCARPPY